VLKSSLKKIFEEVQKQNWENLPVGASTTNSKKYV